MELGLRQRLSGLGWQILTPQFKCLTKRGKNERKIIKQKEKLNEKPGWRQIVDASQRQSVQQENERERNKTEKKLKKKNTKRNENKEKQSRKLWYHLYDAIMVILNTLVCVCACLSLCACMCGRPSHPSGLPLWLTAPASCPVVTLTRRCHSELL